MSKQITFKDIHEKLKEQPFYTVTRTFFLAVWALLTLIMCSASGFSHIIGAACFGLFGAILITGMIFPFLKLYDFERYFEDD